MKHYWLIILSFLCFPAYAQDSTIDGYDYTSAEMVEYHGIIGSPSASATGYAKQYFDASSGKLKCSENGGAYADCVGGGSGGDASGWTDGGTNVYLTATTDNVGIGTTTPFSDTKLTVKGGTATGTNDFIGLFVQNGVTPEVTSVNGVAYKGVWTMGDGGAYLGGRDVTNDIEFLMGTSTLGLGFGGTVTAHPFQIRTTNTSRIQIGTDGNVGIGTSTPNARLTVFGTGTGATPIQNWKNSDGSEKMVILNNGNVGIGSTAPDSILNIPSLKSTTGTRYLCIGTTGIVTSSAIACAGT